MAQVNRRKRPRDNDAMVDASRGAVGGTAAEEQRAEALRARLSGGRGGANNVAPHLGNNNSTVEGYVIQPDPRVQDIQRSVVNRWKQDFITGVSEGRAGLDQEAELGTGQRKTIDCLDGLLIFNSTNTSNHRKTRVQRMIESGQTSEALDRMKRSRFKSRPGSLRDIRRLNPDAASLSTQYGLLTKAKKAFRSIKDDRRLDASLV